MDIQLQGQMNQRGIDRSTSYCGSFIYFFIAEGFFPSPFKPPMAMMAKNMELGREKAMAFCRHSFKIGLMAKGMRNRKERRVHLHSLDSITSKNCCYLEAWKVTKTATQDFMNT